MTDTTSRVGFNVRHWRHGSAGKRVSGTTGTRRRLLQEAARGVDAKWSTKQVARNANIVADHTERNVTLGWVDGTWRRAVTPRDVEAIVRYGDERAAKVHRKQTEKSFETTGIVAHLPKSLLTEVPDFYDSNDGHVGRSRWVCSEEVGLDYAEKVVDYLSENVLRGGREAIHAVSIHFDESVPHVHVMCDTYGDDPKREGWLTCYAQHMWGQRKEPGQRRALSGTTKMKRYQEGFREYMLGHGIEVEKHASQRSRSSMTKAEYAAMQERERDVERYGRTLDHRAKDLDTREKEINKRTSEVEEQCRHNDTREKSLSRDQLSLRVGQNKLKADQDTLKTAQNKLKVDQDTLKTAQNKLAVDTADLDRRKAESIARFNEELVAIDKRRRLMEEAEAELEKVRDSFRKEKELWYATREDELQQSVNARVDEALREVQERAFDLALGTAKGMIKDAVDAAVNNTQWGLVTTAKGMKLENGKSLLDHLKGRMAIDTFLKAKETRERYFNENLTYEAGQRLFREEYLSVTSSETSRVRAREDDGYSL